VATSGTKASLVVVADAWFPGWSAKVDGKSAKVEKADGAFLGVVVGPGDHVITLAYHNGPAALLGRVITGVTVVALLVFALPLPAASRRRLDDARDSLRSGPWNDVFGRLAARNGRNRGGNGAPLPQPERRARSPVRT
jgi:hypothetical protein